MAEPKSLTSRTTSKKITIMAFNYYLNAFRFHYADFEGRARRSEYWYFTLFNIIISYGLMGMMFLGEGMYFMYFVSVLYSLASLIPSLAVAVRRLHDIGKSGWYFLVFLIPVAGIIWLLVLLVTNSQDGENEYGPNPKGIGNNNNDDSMIQNIGQ